MVNNPVAANHDDNRVVIDMEADIHVSSVPVFEVYNISMTAKVPKCVFLVQVETILQFQVEMENIVLQIKLPMTELKCNQPASQNVATKVMAYILCQK